MLVLSRKVDEQVFIGENVQVTVESIRGNQVKLGFDAPRSVPILRAESQAAGNHQTLLTDGTRTDFEHAVGESRLISLKGN